MRNEKKNARGDGWLNSYCAQHYELFCWKGQIKKSKNRITFMKMTCIGGQFEFFQPCCAAGDCIEFYNNAHSISYIFTYIFAQSYIVSWELHSANSITLICHIHRYISAIDFEWCQWYIEDMKISILKSLTRSN